MKRDFKTGIFLIAIGIFATISLVVITGRQAIARNSIPNPVYTFGVCAYEMDGDLTGCYESVKQFYTSQKTVSVKNDIK